MYSKEELRQKRKLAYQEAKAKREADPQYQALKEQAKRDRKARYQGFKEQQKEIKRDALEKKRAEKDAALMALVSLATTREKTEAGEAHADMD